MRGSTKTRSGGGGGGGGWRNLLLKAAAAIVVVFVLLIVREIRTSAAVTTTATTTSIAPQTKERDSSRLRDKKVPPPTSPKEEDDKKTAGRTNNGDATDDGTSTTSSSSNSISDAAWAPTAFQTTSYDGIPPQSKAENQQQQQNKAKLRTMTQVMGELSNAPQCHALGSKFIRYVAEYIVSVHDSMEAQQQQSGGAKGAADESENGAAEEQNGGGGPQLSEAQRLSQQRFWGYHRRLIYSCESNKKGRFCGGMGDRFRGIISSFFLALLTKRKFELYHPTPVPIQEFLHPNILNWIPTIPSDHHQQQQQQQQGEGEGGKRSSSASSVVTPAEIEAEMDRYAPDMSLMRLNKHSKFLAAMAKGEQANTAQWKAGRDLGMRLQSNSYGVDGFLHKAGELLLRRKTEDMGLRPQCNISCYFGCLHHILFRRSKVLGDAMREVMEPVRGGDSGVGERQRQRQTTPLAHPTSPLLIESEDEEHSLVLQRGLDAGLKARLQESHPLRPLITIQVRMGGSWAAGLRIPEPFRTHPAAVKHFFSMIKELRGGGVAGHEHLKGALLFVSSDSERFINETADHFGKENVLQVKGNAFSHTDTLNLGNMKPEKYKVLAKAEVRDNYFRTLLNHQLIGEGDHVVMAQSGFGDTAFWRGRSSASCIFVDMNNNKFGWQHHLSYEPSVKHPLADRNIEQKLRNDKLLGGDGGGGGGGDDDGSSAASDGEKKKVALPAYAVRNRIININNDVKPFY